jgi:hypothetical protein
MMQGTRAVASQTREQLGTLGATSACLAGSLSLLLAGVCFADGMEVPSLFGSVAAAVIACERFLCAARSCPIKGMAWTAIAFGWIALGVLLLHAPSIKADVLPWLVVLLIASSAACRIVRGSSAQAGVGTCAMWIIAAGVSLQLAMIQSAALFGVAPTMVARVAAVAAIELALIGVLSLFQAGAAAMRTHLQDAVLAPPGAVSNTTWARSSAGGE